MNGFIKLHRQLLEWEWYDDIKVKTVFLHLLLTANFKPCKWQGITLERGQLVIGLAKLGSTLGLTVQEIRTSLKKLKSTKEVNIRSTSKYTLVTIVNFGLYQDSEEDSNTQITNEQQTNNKPTTNEQQQRKNDKKERSITYTENNIYKSPILDNDITSIVNTLDFSIDLQNAFRDYCHYLNWKDRKKGGWGNLGQIKKVIATIKDQVQKYNEEKVIKTINEVMDRGNFKIDVSYYEPRKQKTEPKDELTIQEYYEKHLNTSSYRNLKLNYPNLIPNFEKHKEEAEKLKSDLNARNDTLTAALVYDIMYGLFVKAGAKPMSRFAKFKSFFNSLSDYNKNKGDLRALFIQYLKTV